MGNSPQFSNTNMKFQRSVGASEDNPGQKVKVSIWLNFDNGWDDEMKRLFRLHLKASKRLLKIYINK